MIMKPANLGSASLTLIVCLTQVISGDAEIAYSLSVNCSHAGGEFVCCAAYPSLMPVRFEDLKNCMFWFGAICLPLTANKMDYTPDHQM